jgi:hypothetical protein
MDVSFFLLYASEHFLFSYEDPFFSFISSPILHLSPIPPETENFVRQSNPTFPLPEGGIPMPIGTRGMFSPIPNDHQNYSFFTSSSLVNSVRFI